RLWLQRGLLGYEAVEKALNGDYSGVAGTRCDRGRICE
ncbi:MAG: hypothetical protein ACI9Z9_002530, partial [Litorivivens sp.]